jgi:exosortase/archaeosortase family protein
MRHRLYRDRALRVAVLFLVILGALHGLYQLERRTTDRFLDRPFTALVTLAAEGVGRAVLPFPVEQRSGGVLGTEGAAVVVRSGCNGIEALFLMLAGILAVPAPLATRVRVLAMALPFLFFLNLLRIIGLLYVMAEHPDLIAFAHDQVAQGIMVVAVLVLWVRYLGRQDVAAIRV